MPVQIIDNFDLASSKPIDNRIVVGPTPSFYHSKDDIINKYEGLRIWELPGAYIGGGVTNSTANGLGYVWTGSTWIGENTTSISGNGTPGRVAYFNSSNTIQDSNIYYNGSNIGIGSGAESAPAGAKLIVAGRVKSTIGFDGPGGLLTGLNATELTTGTIPIARMPGSINGWIITADTSSSASYKNPNLLTVGYAQKLSATYSLWGQNFNGSQNITGDMVINGQVGRAANLGLLSGGVNSGGTKIATISFQGSAAANKTLSIPTTVANTDTFAFLGTAQTFALSQTFASPTFINNNLTVSLSGTQVLSIVPGSVVFGPTPIFGPSTNPAMIKPGSSGIVSSPSYTFYGDNSTGIYRPSSGVIGFVSGGVEKMRVKSDGVSFGNGTPINTIYVMHAEVKRNGAAPTSVSGTDKFGTAVTYTHVSYVTNQSLVFKLNFPTAMPNTNYYCVAVADNNNGTGNDYRFQCLVTQKNTTWVQILIVQADVRWHSGDVWDNDNPVGITVIAIAI